MRVKMNGQKGVALIVVLLLLSMAVLIATEVLERLEQDRTRTSNLLMLEQGYAYLLSAEALGVHALNNDLEEDNKKGLPVDACTEKNWAVKIGPMPWDNGIFSVSIQDLQGQFNLNNLVVVHDTEHVVDPLQVARLKRILRGTLPGDAYEQADALAEEASDWIDSNTLVDGLGGAEDTEYEDRRTGNTVMAEVSELRALRSANVAAWRTTDDKPQFSRYITALPEGTRVNVNTAPPEVLKALVAGLDETRVQAIIDARGKGPFTSVDELLALPELATLGGSEKQELTAASTVSSEYFRIMSQVSLDGRKFRLVSDVYRPRAGGAPQVIRRDLSELFSTPDEACNAGAVPSDTATDTSADGAP